MNGDYSRIECSRCQARIITHGTPDTLTLTNRLCVGVLPPSLVKMPVNMSTFI